VTEEGPDHAKTFTATVVMGEDVYGMGVGHSKKEAEAQAAESAWLALNGDGDAAPSSTSSSTEPSVVESPSRDH